MRAQAAEITPVIRWAIVDHVLIVLSGTGSVPDDQWQGMHAAMNEEAVRVYLGVSVGSVHLTRAQRQEGAETVKRRKLLAVVVTDERLVRGVVTAVRWLGADVNAFPLDELDQALEFVNLGPEASAVIDELGVGIS